jgi:hypothetical protein
MTTQEQLLTTRRLSHPAYLSPAERFAFEWLITREAPDINAILAELANRPAAHQPSNCRK